MSAPTITDPRTRSAAGRNPNGQLRAVPLRRAWNVPWIVLGVLLVAGSALTFAVLGGSSGNGTRALALAADIAAGEVLTEDLLTTVDVDTTGGVTILRAEYLDRVVGRTAVIGLPAGTLVTEDLFSDSSALAQNEALVGVPLQASALPVAGLRSGDAVMVVRTPSPSDPSDAVTPAVWRATVFGVASAASPSGDVKVVTLKVDPRDAPGIAAAAATDRVRLILVRSLDDVPPELLFSELLGEGGREAEPAAP